MAARIHRIYIDVLRADDPGGTMELLAIFDDGTGQRIENVPPGADIPFPKRVKQLAVGTANGGYWLLLFDNPANAIAGVLRPLPSGPRAWWHALHNVPLTTPRGEDIRIGVIDEALPRLPPTSVLGHVRNVGGAAWDAASHRAYVPMDVSGHGFSVCALLASRPRAPGDYEGVAPDADIVFAAAGSEDSERLDETRLAESIVYLAVDEQCDIITFSAGDVPTPMSSVREALIAAQDEGVICFAAAGNEGHAPQYPARFVECLAVGAVGSVSVVPRDSADGQAIHAAPLHCSGDTFHWASSARGPDVDFLGAGASVFAPDDTGAWHPRSGTSFAAPIVAGVAALVLSKDIVYQQLKGKSERVKHALARLEAVSSNPFRTFCRLGIPVA